MLCSVDDFGVETIRLLTISVQNTLQELHSLPQKLAVLERSEATNIFENTHSGSVLLDEVEHMEYNFPTIILKTSLKSST